jgi:hypothetical protein
VRPGFSPLCSKLCSGNQSHPINPINSLIMHSSAPIPAPVLRWSTATRPRETRRRRTSRRAPKRKMGLLVTRAPSFLVFVRPSVDPERRIKMMTMRR